MQTNESGLLEKIGAIVGEDRLILSSDEIRFFSLDLSEQPGAMPAAVARPSSAEEIAATVRLCAESGYAVVARGGGVSYSRSHLPIHAKTIVIDLRSLDTIREINLRDRYVVVETGVTWFQLREALAGTGYRVPYQGTYSGRIATIGGGLSQNATGMGRGTLAEHVLGLEVVLGDGSIIQTGSSMISNTPPFYRYNGPDLTGMFLCDSGAFGIKTTAVLLLEPVPKASYGCFAFDSEIELVRAQAAMIGAGYSFESFGWGRNFLRSLADGPVPSTGEQFVMASEILRRAPNKYRAARALWRAWSPNGLGYLGRYLCAMSVIAEAHSEAEADRIMSEITKIAKKSGGTVLPSTLAFGSRHGPYPDMSGLLFSKDDEIWFPVNGKFPMSRIEGALTAIHDFTRAVAPRLERHQIRLECNFLTHGYFCGLEPIFFWKRRSPYRERFAPARGGETELALPEMDAATETVLELRDALIRCMRELGALQLQWGKLYPYAESLGADEQRLVAGLKRVVDPKHIINPGVLGLDRIQ